jgi:hypothetical protein
MLKDLCLHSPEEGCHDGSDLEGLAALSGTVCKSPDLYLLSVFDLQVGFHNLSVNIGKHMGERRDD